MAGLEGLPGMRQALEEAVLEKGRPFLGICVGMQLLAETGLEHGTHTGLGWIPGTVEKVAPNEPSLKIPHMGWNEMIVSQPEHPMLAGIHFGDHAYFVHSYTFRPKDPSVIAAKVSYGGDVTAAVGRDNIFGTQFHPEKSQAVGLRLLSNFLSWSP